EEPVDDVDWVTKTDLTADLELDIEKSDAGMWKRDLNVLASPAQSIRDIFDLMAHDTESDWSTIAGRMKNLPGAIDGYIETLRQGIADGITPARRQVTEVLGQLQRNIGDEGFFATFAGGAKTADGDLPEALRNDLAA